MYSTNLISPTFNCLPWADSHLQYYCMPIG